MASSSAGGKISVDKDALDIAAQSFRDLAGTVKKREILQPSGFTSSNDSAQAVAALLSVAVESIGAELADLGENVSNVGKGFDEFETETYTGMAAITAHISGSD
jgi:hypothetical protein